MIQSTRTFPVLALAYVLAELSVAQQVYDGRMTRSPLGQSASAPYSNMVVGHFTPDARLDSVSLGNGVLQMVDGLDSHGAVFPLPTAGELVLDVAVLEGLGPQAPDSLVVLTVAAQTGTVSLLRLDFDTAAATSAAPFTATRLDAVGWQDVTAIETGDLDGDRVLEVIGLGHRAVHRIELTSAGVQEVGVTPLTDPFLDLHVGKWRHDEVDALFVSSPDRIEVVDVTGVGLARIDAFTGTLTDFATWRDRGEGRLAVVSKEDSSNTSWIQVFGESGYQEPRQTLGITDPIRIVAADFYGDGHADVGLLLRFSSTLVCLLNSGGPPPGSLVTFSTSDTTRMFGDPFSISPATSMGTQSGEMVAADVDGDGDVDVAFACDATGDVHVKRNSVVIETAQMCDQLDVGTVYRRHPVHTNPLGGPYSPLGAEADIAIQLPPDVSGHTHLELVVYQTDLPGPPEVAAHEIYSLQGLPPIGLSTGDFSALPRVDLMGHYRALQNAPDQDQAAYLVCARLVTFANGQAQAGSVETTYGFTHTRTYLLDENGERTGDPVIGTPSPPTPVGDPGTLPPRRVPPPQQPPSSTGG